MATAGPDSEERSNVYELPGMWAESFVPAKLDHQRRQLRFSDEQFDALCMHLHDSGGIARGDELAHLLDDHPPGTRASLSQLIASDQIFGFERDGTFWVPMFQFETETLHVNPGLLEVRAELRPDFDGWALATWFAEPNVWLRGRRPVDLFVSKLPEVLVAARIDRFIAVGDESAALL